jgi:hypothetical protein
MYWNAWIMPAIGMIPRLFGDMGFPGCNWRSYLTVALALGAAYENSSIDGKLGQLQTNG